MRSNNKIVKELLTVNNIRFNNKVNIMTHIVRAEEVTRNELAQRNGISIMTVKHIIDELLAQGVIEEHVCQSTVGRKPMALSLSKNYGNIICMNLTSPKSIEYVIYDMKDLIIERKSFDCLTNQKSYRENLLNVIENLKGYLKTIELKTIGIAVFVPGAYYEDLDLVNYDLIPDLKDLHIKELFGREFHNDNVQVIHDAYAAAKSEYERMGSEGESQFYFYCGEGVGGFFIYKGTPVTGDDLVAGEIGKILLPSTSTEHSSITLEEYASVQGIVCKVNQIYPGLTFGEILERYQEGDLEITNILNDVIEAVARVLHSIVWVCNPRKIVIDSCSNTYRELLVDHTRKFLFQHKAEEIPFHVEVEEALYDEYHMMRGCKNLVLEKWIEKIALLSAEGFTDKDSFPYVNEVIS